MEISIGEALGLNKTFIDLRSPKEFREDTIPGAVNIPLFDNKEHAIMGTLYHQDGQEKAFEEGLKIVTPKLNNMIKQISKHKDPIVFCWRGGMRSKCVHKYLTSKDIESKILQGGYREYRRHVNKELQQVKIPKLIVLYGLAGVGKTKLIRKLNNSVDLEGFAQHRASLFGGLGLEPRSQKMFESLLLHSLRSSEDFLIVEGESRRIGDLHIPGRFFNAMKGGIRIWIDCDKQKRIQNLMGDYGKASKEELKAVLVQLKKFLSKTVYLRMQHYVDINDYEKLAEILLDKYYDEKYLHNLSRNRYDYVVDATDQGKAVERIRTFINETTNQA
ncbi:MAG: tRNA 2-selenouridine(34) synthase MnmH [Nanoarchaeota archaeon]|nr:tRNA 2-selenouridine(34) synthase MnmH [Nanoarchaeota archaeon]